MATDKPPRLVLAEGTFPVEEALLDAIAGTASMESGSLDTLEAVSALPEGTDGVIVGLQRLTAEHITALPKSVRLISRAGIGLDSIDLEAARAAGIGVLHQPDYATKEVATHAVAMLMALCRRLPEANELARGDWAAWQRLPPLLDVASMTVGVVGGGTIGREVIRLLTPMVEAVVVYDPYAQELGVSGSVVRAMSLAELLSQTDAVTVHVPLTGETRGMFGQRELEQMRPGSLLVNVSRGGIVDELALARVLESGHLGGAALDVLVDEPPSPDEPILRSPRTILTPHIAWNSTGSVRRLQEQSVWGAIDVLLGSAPRAGRLAVEPKGMS